MATREDQHSGLVGYVLSPTNIDLFSVPIFYSQFSTTGTAVKVFFFPLYVVTTLVNS